MKETVLVTAQAREGAFDDLVTEMRTIVENAKDNPGCLGVELLLSKDRNEIAIYAHWQSAEALNDFLVWRSEQPNFGQSAEFMVGEPNIRSYTLLPLQAALSCP